MTVLGIREALSAAEADGSMLAFFSDLRSCGGRVVAETLEGCLEALLREKEEEGGGQKQATAAAAAAAAAAASHERLHSGAWHAVPHAWRDAYALACLVQAEGEEKGGNEESTMRLLDLALLLGGVRFRRLAHAAADALLSQSSLSSSASTPSTSPFPDAWPPPTSPVELPPGSMQEEESSKGKRVEVLAKAPSLEEFLSRALRPSGPFVIPRSAPSFAAYWPALQLWRSPRYWDSVAGKRTVPVEVGSSYLAEGWSQRLTTLRRFIGEQLTTTTTTTPTPATTTRESDDGEKAYLAQHDLLEQVPALSRDVVVPDYALALCGGGEKGEDDDEKNDDDSSDDEDNDDDGDDGDDNNSVACNLWLGPSATLSPLHTDPKRNLFCQVVGRKYVRLYGPECGGVLLRRGGGGGDNGDDEKTTTTLTAALTSANTSSVDLFSSTPGSDPLLSSLSFVDTFLGPGDVLFIPQGWWHFVLSLETSASVSFWF